MSITKIPPDILEGLYKVRIRESEKLKTALELYDLEIDQKKLGPDYKPLNRGFSSEPILCWPSSCSRRLGFLVVFGFQMSFIGCPRCGVT